MCVLCSAKQSFLPTFEPCGALHYPGFEGSDTKTLEPTSPPWEGTNSPRMGSPTSEINAIAFTKTNVDYLDGLFTGYKWKIPTNKVLEYSFMNGSSAFDSSYSNDNEYTAMQTVPAAFKSSVQDVLAVFAKYIDVTFTEVTETSTENGTFRFGFTSDSIMNGTPAWAYGPSTTYHGEDHPAFPNGGDVWTNADVTYADWTAATPGSYEFSTILHETGHAFGLKHPHSVETNSNAEWIWANTDQTYNALPSELDSIAHTVMSYRDYIGGSTTGGYSSEKFPTTLMHIDILALQHLYGANTSTNLGNTTYQWTDSFVFETIFDNGGTDTITWAGKSTVAKIDLRGGAYASYFGNFLTDGLTDFSVADTGTLQILDGTVIENVIGGNGNDIIVANAVNNDISGGAGDDQIVGWGGTDSLAGGSGSDIFWCVSTDTASTINITDFSFSDDTLKFVYDAADGSLPTLASSTELSAGDITQSLTQGDGYKCYTLEGGSTVTLVGRTNNAASGTLTISGSTGIGQVITANSANIADLDGLSTPNAQYRWYRDNNLIQGETGQTYTIQSGDGGKSIKSEYYFTDDLGWIEYIQSNTLTVSNSAPTISTTTSISTNEASASAAIAFSGSDADGNSLTFTFGTPTNGTVVNNGNGTFTYTPNANYNGSDSFTLTVNDGTVDVVETINVTVNAVNDAPTLATTTSISTNEDSASAAIAFSGSDVDGNSLTYTFGTPTNGTVVNNGDGTFTYTPNANYNGSDSFTLTVNDGTVDVVETINVTVNAVNDAPTLTTTTSININADSASTPVSFTANDIDGDSLTYTFSTPTNGAVVNNGNGTFTYTPNTSFVGSDSFTLTVNDGTVDVTETINVTVSDGQTLSGSLSSSRKSAEFDGDPAHYPAAEVFAVSTDSSEDLFLRATSINDETIFEIVAKPSASIQSFDFILTGSGGVTLGDFVVDMDLATDLGSSGTLTTGTSNTELSFTLTATNGSLASATEHVLATFTATGQGTLTVSQGELGTTSIPTLAYDISKDTADASGNYDLSFGNGDALQLQAHAEYVVPSTNPITPSDALEVLKTVVRINQSPTPEQLIAGDVDKDGKLTPSDALSILKKVVRMDGGVDPEWIFIDGAADYTSMGFTSVDYDDVIDVASIISATTINFEGILLGDFDGTL